MSKIGTKWLAGALATGVLLAGLAGGTQWPRAHADGASAAVEHQHGQPGGERGHAMGERRAFPGFGSMPDVASLLGMERSAMMEELKQGKTIAQIALDKQGWSEDTLLQKLAEAAGKTIDQAVQDGKLTQEQADKQKESLTERLKRFIAQPPGADRRPGPRDGRGFDAWGGPDALAPILGVSQEELSAALKSGKSLAEIAQEQGIDEEQLIAKLKDSMTDKLKHFVEQKRQPQPSKK